MTTMLFPGHFERSRQAAPTPESPAPTITMSKCSTAGPNAGASDGRGAKSMLMRIGTSPYCFGNVKSLSYDPVDIDQPGHHVRESPLGCFAPKRRKEVHHAN